MNNKTDGVHGIARAFKIRQPRDKKIRVQARTSPQEKNRDRVLCCIGGIVRQDCKNVEVAVGVVIAARPAAKQPDLNRTQLRLAKNHKPIEVSMLRAELGPL